MRFAKSKGLKDVRRRDKSTTAGILRKRSEKLFIVEEPCSWLHSGLLSVRLRPGSKENMKPKLDPAGRTREGVCVS